MSDPVTYTAVLPIGEPTAAFVSQLLAGERARRRTRRGRRALGCYRQAVLVLRWFLDATRVAQLATENQLSSSTTYRYLHEGIDVLAAAIGYRRPQRRGPGRQSRISHATRIPDPVAPNPSVPTVGACGTEALVAARAVEARDRPMACPWVNWWFRRARSCGARGGGGPIPPGSAAGVLGRRAVPDQCPPGQDRRI